MNVTLDKICLVLIISNALTDLLILFNRSDSNKGAHTCVVISAVISFNFELGNKKRLDLLIMSNALGF